MMKDTRPTCASLAELAARSGASVPCAGNLPVKLDDPDSVWFIEQGTVDLFLVEFRRRGGAGGAAASSAPHFRQAGAGCGARRAG